MSKKEDRIKAKANGICIYCLKHQANKGVACEGCYITRIAYRKKIKSAGICTACSKNIAIKNETRCVECKELKRIRDKNTKLKRIEEGLCIYCGVRSQQENIHTCYECALKNKSREHFGNKLMWQVLGDLFENQNGICPYTGIKLTLGGFASLDHKVPKIKGGTNEIKNLQWVHPLVNIAKHTHSHEEFLSLIKKIYEFCNLNQLSNPTQIPETGHVFWTPNS